MNRFALFVYFTFTFSTLYAGLNVYGQEYFQILIYILALIPFCIIAWLWAYFLYDLTFIWKVKGRGKAVLITGCSSGFGLRLAKRLDALEFTVFACVRNVYCEGAKELRQDCSDRLQVCKVDVTSPEEVQDVVKRIRASRLPLWAVVNNAGMALGMPWDWGFDIDQYKQTFEVNLFGVVRLTKACAALLRESRGRVINVCSFAGRTTCPLMGAYCMSKHAQRSFSNALRLELMNDGVKVIVVEPTFYKTPIVDFDRIRRVQTEHLNASPKEIQVHYDEKKLHRVRNSDQITQVYTRQKVNEVVSTLVRVVTLSQPKLYYRVSGMFELLMWIPSVAPEAISDVVFNIVVYSRYSIGCMRLLCRLLFKPVNPLYESDMMNSHA